MTTRIVRHSLEFKVPSGTSRGVLTDKPSWFVITTDDGQLRGVGECSLILGLSPDQPDEIEAVLHRAINHDERVPKEFPAARFCIEMWKKSLEGPDPYSVYPSTWDTGTHGLPINGLIWMGSKDFMNQQIKQKLDEGFDCIKMKIGAIDFEDEYELLANVRKEFSASDITLRVDANGAFDPKEALDKLNRLAELELHSIEQPIRPNNWEEMASLCASSPLDIALDEELIGVYGLDRQQKLLETIRPAYIILKPSLLGGISASDQWISLAEKLDIGWWATSALESNIGLNTITQWVATKEPSAPQGLGTGGLFTNNIVGPLYISGGQIWTKPFSSWDISMLHET